VGKRIRLKENIAPQYVRFSTEVFSGHHLDLCVVSCSGGVGPHRLLTLRQVAAEDSETAKAWIPRRRPLSPHRDAVKKMAIE